MLTESERERLRWLQGREHSKAITDRERAELDDLVAKVEADEAAALAPAISRIASDADRIEMENAALRGALLRKKRLANRLERVLTLAAAEQDAINSDVLRVLGINSTPHDARR